MNLNAKDLPDFSYCFFIWSASLQFYSCLLELCFCLPAPLLHTKQHISSTLLFVNNQKQQVKLFIPKLSVKSRSGRKDAFCSWPCKVWRQNPKTEVSMKDRTGGCLQGKQKGLGEKPSWPTERKWSVVEDVQVRRVTLHQAEGHSWGRHLYRINRTKLSQSLVAMHMSYNATGKGPIQTLKSSMIQVSRCKRWAQLQHPRNTSQIISKYYRYVSDTHEGAAEIWNFKEKNKDSVSFQKNRWLFSNIQLKIFNLWIWQYQELPAFVIPRIAICNTKNCNTFLT